MQHTHSHPAGALGGHHHDSPRRRLALTFLLISSFMVVEVVGGVVSGSLALLADAGHMLTDALALALSYFAVWLSAREVSPTRTYGFRRAELLVAFANALGLMLLAIWIVIEAVERFNDPQPVLDGVLLLVAVGGLLVNLAAWALLHRAARDNLSVRSALWHVLGDLLGSVGAIAAALVIRFTGWMPADALIGGGIGLLIAVGSARILYDSTNLLLDSVPGGIDSVEVRAFLTDDPDVMEICDLHIWSVSSRESMFTAHLVVAESADRDQVLHRLLEALRSRFGLSHMTLQLEGRPMESCDPEW